MNTLPTAFPRRSVVWLCLVLFSLVGMAACGGDNSLAGQQEIVDGETPTEEVPGDGSPAPGSPTPAPSTAQLTVGSFDDAGNFQAGIVDVGLSTLSAGGSTSVTVVLADETGGLFNEPVTVAFSSDCSLQGLSRLDSPVISNNGIATTTYVADGCVGNDNIVALAQFEQADSSTLDASGSINVLQADVGSIEFVSANPAQIGLRASGQQSFSSVTFLVRDVTGRASPGRDVRFSLNTQVGGIILDPETGVSSADGTVRTVVRAGTVSTPVRVTAEIDAPDGNGGTVTLRTQSSQLVIGTGFPDQDSMSLAVETLNPEAFDIDGVVVPVTAFVADRFNNPVADGTGVSFFTEGASVQANCQTVDGACSVNWRSQAPRPNNGRTTLLATVLGEESFRDLNGNGVFNNGELTDDVSEAFLDRNEDGFRSSSNEEFLDFDGDGQFDLADGIYQGSACDDSQPGNNCENVLAGVHVRSLNVIQMARSTADIRGTPESIDLTQGAVFFRASVGGCYERNNPCNHDGPHGPETLLQKMPAGTTIIFTTTNGDIPGLSAFEVANTSSVGPTLAGVVIEPDDEPSFGTLTVTVTTPLGVVTNANFSVVD